MMTNPSTKVVCGTVYAAHLLEYIQRYGVEHVVDDDPQHRTGGCSQSLLHI